jgi:hypothetical protein
MPFGDSVVIRSGSVAIDERVYLSGIRNGAVAFLASRPGHSDAISVGWDPNVDLLRHRSYSGSRRHHHAAYVWRNLHSKFSTRKNWADAACN